jgi:FtsH-binding integral membrane protein
MDIGASRSIPGAVATVDVDERREFIKKTYMHLAGAVGMFVLVSWALVQSSIAKDLTMWAVGGGQWNWMLFLGLFMVVGYVADKWANSDTSRGMQYLGLGLYVVAEAFMFTPMLYIAAYYMGDKTIIPTAAGLTGLIFGGLTLTVLLTKKDFSFLRGALGIGGFAALGLIVMGAIFGFSLGLWFSFAMVLLASGYILYYTSAVMAHYRPTQYVAAALALFAAVALLFWYILQIVMSLASE